MQGRRDVIDRRQEDQTMRRQTGPGAVDRGATSGTGSGMAGGGSYPGEVLLPTLSGGDCRSQFIPSECTINEGNPCGCK